MLGGFEVSLRLNDAQNRMPELINATKKQLDTAVNRAAGRWSMAAYSFST